MSKGLAEEQVRALMGNLNPARVAHRKQGGRDLSYLEAFDVKATLIRLFGFGGFSAECIDTRILREHWYQKDSKDLVQVTAMCTVRLTIHATGAVYTESGAASQSGPDHGEVADFAIKTAESDALKRAATYLGTQLGLSLYDQGTTREVVRVLFAPKQKKMLAAVGADLTAQNVQVLQESLGAVIVDESPDSAPDSATPEAVTQ